VENNPDQFIVIAQGIYKSYSRGAQKVPVLHGIDLQVREGEFLALMGPSGSGKTTLLNLVAGLDRPDSGRLVVAGVPISELGETDLARWRAIHVGFVFQFYNLLPVLNALENVELPLQLRSLSRKERREHAVTALELVGLAGRLRHHPGQLSGGEQQRVAIARAIVTDPSLIVADEPTGDLDKSSAREILAMLEQLNTESGKTIIMVTHDPKAAESAGRMCHLDKGVLNTNAC
jgi:putative ABC transport system ATP-binding protein